MLVLCVLSVLPADESISGYRVSTDPEDQKFWEIQKSVARISVPAGLATAWVVGDKYMLTNKHVIGDASDAQRATVSFLDASTGNNGDSYSDLKLVKLGGGDWALFEVNDSDWDPVAHPPIEIDLDPQPHQVLYVIGHPNRRISRSSEDDRDNYRGINPGLPLGSEGLGHTWADSAGNLAGASYGVPTAPGYSGSPVMTLSGGQHRASALHRGPSNGIWLFNIVPSIYRWLAPRSKGALGYDLLEGRIQDDGDVEIVLLDLDLAHSGTQVLTVTTDSGDSESLTLTELDEKGKFSGTLLLADLSSGVTANNAILEVASMDRIITTYLDADDGSGSPATVVHAEPVDRRAADGWFFNPRATPMTQSRIDFTADPTLPNRYNASIQPIATLLPHSNPSRHPQIGWNEEVVLNLGSPLKLYGMEVSSLRIQGNGQILVDGLPAYELHVFGYNAYNQTCTINVEENAAGLLVTWDDVPVSPGSDNVAYVGESSSFQLFWSRTGNLSFLYSENSPSANQASIGLKDGPETDAFVATDFLSLPRGDSPVSAPLIVFEPLDQSAAEFYPVQMQVRAVGQGSLSYQWFENGSPIPDTNTDFYLSFSQPASGAANYHVVVTDDHGSVSSRVARYQRVSELSLFFSDPDLSEGDPASILRFERQGVTDHELTVFYTLSGSMDPQSDVWTDPPRALTGSVTFPAGENRVEISVSALDDLLDEGSETLQVQLTPSPTYILSFQSQDTLTLRDQDTAPNLRRYLINFGESAYSQDGSRIWQSFDLTQGDNPQHITDQLLVDTQGASSGGLKFSTSGGSLTGDAYPLHSSLLASHLGAEPFDWFDADSSQQRQTYAVRSGSEGWTFSFSGFSPEDVVDIEFVFAREGSGDRAMTVTRNSIGDVFRDQQVDSENGGQFPVLTRLSGQSSYAFTISPTGSGWGCLPNAIALHVRHAFAEAPGNLKAFAVEEDEVQLSWTDNSSTESGYRIERANSASGPWTLLHTAAAGSESYVDQLASPGSYVYRVVVQGGNSDGMNSNFDLSSGLDRDSDGVSDDHEGEAGTNPDNAQDVLAVRMLSTPSGMRLQAPTVSGRQYRVSRKESLTDLTWIELQQWNSDGSDLDLPVADAGFYRVEVWIP